MQITDYINTLVIMTRGRGISCSKCNIKIDRYDHFINCKKCDNNYHIKCVNLTMEDLNKIRGNTSQKWFCDNCQQAATSDTNTGEFSSVEVRITKEDLLNMKRQIVSEISSAFLEEIGDLKSLISSQSKQISELKKEICVLVPNKNPIATTAGAVITESPCGRDSVAESSGSIAHLDVDAPINFNLGGHRNVHDSTSVELRESQQGRRDNSSKWIVASSRKNKSKQKSDHFERSRNPATAEKSVTSKQVLKPIPNDPTKRSVFVLRHAERVDFVFGKWVPHCFDEAGNYLRKDLNLPPSIPPRKTGPQGYSTDGPITSVGTFYARSIGEVFKSNNVNIDHVYCSPSFRCVQTLDTFLQGLGKKNDIKIRVDPCIFEWTLWYPNIPEWMSLEELVAAGFNIDTDYKPFKSRSDITAKETVENFYSRSAEFSKKLLQDHPTGNILVVGHSATLDTLTRHLIQGKGARDKDELFGLISKVPYCSLVQITEEGDKWNFVDPPCPPMTYCVNHRFDWKVLLTHE